MERTYVFNQDGNNGNGGGSKFDIMAMLPNLMGSKGVDPGLLALLNQGRGSQDQWGGSWWFIWIILLWFCWGGKASASPLTAVSIFLYLSGMRECLSLIILPAFLMTSFERSFDNSFSFSKLNPIHSFFCVAFQFANGK